MSRSGQTFIFGKKRHRWCFVHSVAVIPKVTVLISFLIMLGLLICLKLCYVCLSLHISVPFPLWLLSKSGIILEIMWTSYSPVVSHPVFFIPWWSSPASVITLMIAKWWLKNSVIPFTFISRYSFIMRRGSLLPSPPLLYHYGLWILFCSVYYVIINILFFIPK